MNIYIDRMRLFTAVKEIDIRVRICNNLDLIEQSAFVTIPANRPAARDKNKFQSQMQSVLSNRD